MRKSSCRTHTAVAMALWLVAAPLTAAIQFVEKPICPIPIGPTVDNRDGYFVNLEEGPVHPLELTADSQELWAVNIPDASVVVFNASNPTSLVQLAVIKVGLGPVTIRQRPGTREMWVVCQSSNSVFIVDRTTRRVVESIRLAHEPAGLVFDAGGGRAWVTLSASQQVKEIDAVTRTEAATFEVATNFPNTSSPLIHAEEPRALLLGPTAQDLYVLSLESGNGTMNSGNNVNSDPINNLWDSYSSSPTTFPPPPDRDVLRFALPGPSAGSVALWRTGSLNFDLKLDNAGSLWVSNVDFNNTLKGEFQFPTNHIARHRLTRGTPLLPGAPAPTAPPFSIDLNQNLPSSLVQARYACAMPNEMAFSANFQTMYVACYETHNVAVVSFPASGTPSVVAELRGLTTIPLTGERRNFGVRGLVLREAARVLYTYSRDNRIQVYNVPVPNGTVASPVQTLPIGFDVTTAKVKEGRFHNIDSRRSASLVQSCNTCHVDGHFDRIAWNLSDFTGDLPGSPLPRVPKGTKVTMSLRGIEETPPFHWRGDRADLAAFNPAFQGLLGGTQLTPSQLAAFEAFIFSLSYPANPLQNDDRTFSPAANAGSQVFRCKESHSQIGFNKATPPLIKALTCEDCHSMAGFSATNNQVNNDLVGQFADDATQLRGLFDKIADVVDYGAALPPPFNTVQRVPANGWGFANTGFVRTLLDFVNLGVFDLNATEDAQVVKFMEELDTGIAPAAAFAWTLNRASSGSANQPFNTLLQAQAEAGNADLIARGWIRINGVPTTLGLLYRPGPGNGFFEPSISTQPNFLYQDLVNLANNGDGVFTLIGTPVGMGYRLALDEEMDFLKDGDETAAHAIVGVYDSDGDQFPDGYEVRLGSDPGNAASLPPPDTVAPAVQSAHVAWRNGSVAKIRWQTDEESISRIEAHPAGTIALPPAAVKEERKLKKRHVLVVRGLEPGKSYDFHVMTEDPSNPNGSGNSSLFILSGGAQQPFFFQAVRVSLTTLTAAATPPGNPVQLTATFTVVDRAGNPVSGATVTFEHVEWIPGQGNTTPAGVSHSAGPSDGSGIATATFTSTNTAGSGGKAEVYVTQVAEPLNRFYFHPLDGQFGFWAQASLP